MKVDPTGTHRPPTMQAQPSETIDFPCQSCGSKLHFQPGTNNLACPHCGSQHAIQNQNTPIIEHDFSQAMASQPSEASKQLLGQGVQHQCQGCGAQTIVQQQAEHCPFCDAPIIIQQNDHPLMAPESILPFQIDRSRAQTIFLQWVKTRYFAPNNLRKQASQYGISGIYLPYWTYDTLSTTSYTGMRGINYYETETYTDSDGKRQTRTVTKTRWYPCFGTVVVDFDDILVCASRSLPSSLVDPLEPWELHRLRTFSPEYLAGFIAERYRIDLPEGFRIAQEKMAPEIRSAIRRDIGGDTQQILSMDVSHANIRFKHFLLPLWISSFRYHDKIYRFIVNACTGEANGERPYSIPKIVAAVLAVAAIITGLILLKNHLDSSR